LAKIVKILGISSCATVWRYCQPLYMHPSIADLRQDYRRQALLEHQADPNPMVQFQQWFDQAVAADLLEPNAMTLATVDATGQPSARIVLLKGIEHSGFTFFTNYQGRKGQELAQNPKAALVFWWGELERQVRVEGQIIQITSAESEAYFHSRPVGSQLGAWASQQSQVIPDRQILETRLADLKTQYEGAVIPRPEHWGGYRLTPHAIEFWQGRSSRLHDRLLYTLQSQPGAAQSQWLRVRLAP
jgi:pyridoxamine 5'-phosphate oxidase